MGIIVGEFVVRVLIVLLYVIGTVGLVGLCACCRSASGWVLVAVCGSSTADGAHACPATVGTTRGVSHCRWAVSSGSAFR